MLKENLIQKISTVDGWLSISEAIFLYEAARRVVGNGDIVEIGSFKGKSTICLAMGQKETGVKQYVWAVDPHEGVIKGSKKSTADTYEEFLKNLKDAEVFGLVKPLRKTSRQSAKTWKNAIRLLFIDGLHDSAHATEDYLLWESFVLPGGIIAFHDGFCGEDGVWRAISEGVFKRTDVYEIGTVGSILFVILGHPGFVRKQLVNVKKSIISFCQWIYKKNPPVLFQVIFIHRICRLLLMTSYTRAVYTAL